MDTFAPKFTGPRVARAKRKSRWGQGAVEFGLTLPLALLLICACFDYAFYWTTRIDNHQAARDAARFASVYATAWSNANPPAANTIEYAAYKDVVVPSNLVNDDTHVTIAYWDTTKVPYALCGQYSAASNAFVAQTGYDQANCVQVGNEIIVTLNTSYTPLTPLARNLFGTTPPVGGFPITSAAGIIQEK